MWVALHLSVRREHSQYSLSNVIIGHWLTNSLNRTAAYKQQKGVHVSPPIKSHFLNLDEVQGYHFMDRNGFM
jgi:hypothetical protein